MKKKILRYFTKGCIAFTFSCIFYLLFSVLSIFPPFNQTMLINMLLISISIIALIFMTHQLPVKHLFISRLLEICVVVLVLLVTGAITGMFPFTGYYIFTVSMTGLLTYIVVILVTFIDDQASAKKINTAIKKRKTGVSNEQNY